MKLSCTQENLQQGLNVVGKIVRPQATLPVLSNILLKTEHGRLRISSTDLEIGTTCFIGAKVEKEGTITLPARLLSDYVLMNNDKKIDFSVSGTTVELKSERYQAKIKGIEASEFPLIPEVKEKPNLFFQPKELKEAISQVLIAPSFDETKPTLSGIYLRILGKEVKIAATDSFRLAEKTLVLEKEADQKEVIIPTRTLSEISRILSLVNPAMVSAAISSNQILFNLDNIFLVSRLIEGKFPDYEPIIPKTTETTATLEVGDFQNSLKMANLFAKETGSNVKLKLKKDKVVIEATSSLVGENISTVAANSEGPETEITFNVRFLLDVLSVVPFSKIILGVSGKTNPAIIRPFGRKDYFYLIMPLRIEE